MAGHVRRGRKRPSVAAVRTASRKGGTSVWRLEPPPGPTRVHPPGSTQQGPPTSASRARGDLNRFKWRGGDVTTCIWRQDNSTFGKQVFTAPKGACRSWERGPPGAVETGRRAVRMDRALLAHMLLLPTSLLLLLLLKASNTANVPPAPVGSGESRFTAHLGIFRGGMKNCKEQDEGFARTVRS